jgi:hypothetical protein
MKSGCRSCALAAASSSALGISRRKITHTFTSIWAMPVRSSAPIALRYSVSIRAWPHTKPIRQIVLTVTWTELKSSNAASFVIPAAAAPAPGAIIPQSRGGSRWPRAIRIRQDASVTTAEPTIPVARDQAIDRVADHPWDEVDDPCPLSVRNLARDAQRGFGFYIGLAHLTAFLLDHPKVTAGLKRFDQNRNTTLGHWLILVCWVGWHMQRSSCHV